MSGLEPDDIQAANTFDPTSPQDTEITDLSIEVLLLLDDANVADGYDTSTTYDWLWAGDER